MRNFAVECANELCSPTVIDVLLNEVIISRTRDACEVVRVSSLNALLNIKPYDHPSLVEILNERINDKYSVCVFIY